MVTRNLDAILHRLQEKCAGQRFWIDALSINQSDILDRNEQVSQMRHVYASASLTLLWLGTDEHDGIRKLLTMMAFCFSTFGPEHGRLTFHLPPHIAVSLLTIMHAIAQLDYWQRAWVAQEIMFSRMVWLVYGSIELLYHHFHQMWTLFCDHFLRARRQISVEWPRWRSFSMMARVINGGPHALPKVNSGLDGDHVSVEEWARTGITKQCTDARDAVFAYHGCFPPQIREQLKIDYCLPLRQVLPTMTKLYLQTTGTLNPILNAIRTPTDLDLPSWVPFGQSSSATPLYVRLSDGKRRRACGQHPAQFAFSDDSMALRVKAVRIGTVRFAAEAMKYDFDALEKWVEYGEVYDDTRHSFKQAIQGVNEALHSPNLPAMIETFLDVESNDALIRDSIN